MVYNKKVLQPLLFYLLLCVFIITVEMRPGRVYQLLQMLLFQGSVLSLMLYLFVFALTAWSIHIALLNKHKMVVIGYLLLLFPVLSISLVYRFITGYNFAYADAQIALNNLHLLPDALQSYSLPIIMAVGSAFLLCLLGWFINQKAAGLYKPQHLLLVLPLIFISYWYIRRSMGNVDDLPVVYRVPLSTLAAYKDILPLNAREPVAVVAERPGVKHLFLIVDESITGSNLSLNGFTLPTTPYLQSVADSLINFGIASSYTNQSAGSNIALIGGLQLAELPDQRYFSLTRPGIFQYAQTAGYTTYFIDAQIGKGLLQNYMSLQDLQHIDHFVQISELHPELPYYQRDFAGADLLLQIMRREEKSFVYFNKAGAHWPYARTYQPDSILFSPVLAQQSMLKSREKSRNTYFNAIRWTVDGFWNKLLPAICPQDSTFVVYTSDHGQDLSGDGISISHASIYETAPVEGDVPLWILDKTGFSNAYPKPQPNRQSHAQIFPTLLLLQGYDIQYIRNNYGITLFDRVPATPRFFISGDIFGRGQHAKILF
ncbi:MAG: sulfatase-like hydrolase/transferase [Bacteroidetes bacterium]|nr:sulfatase-like hydrolase/transferase [Bacteroidota bacterium]